MNVGIFVGVCLTMALTIWGRTLRERAFHELSPGERSRVLDKLPNYSATEMIPFAGLTLGLVGLLLFRPVWLKAGFALYAVLTVTLVVVFHLRTRRRFRQLGLSEGFLSAYEYSRWVSYSALAVPLAFFAWFVR
jgi:hypothetical protein